MRLLTKEDILSFGESRGETLMRRFCEAVESGLAPNPDVMKFLARAFRDIQNGKNPKKALDIERHRGRKGEDWRYQLDADNVALAMRSMSYGKAVAKVAAETGQAYKTVQRHYSRHKETAHALVEFRAFTSAVHKAVAAGKLTDLFYLNKRGMIQTRQEFKDVPLSSLVQRIKSIVGD